MSVHIRALLQEEKPQWPPLWQGIYWQTAACNKTAQHLCDKLATRTDWARYEMAL